MNSPFKFLDAYTLKDKDTFFGREKEVEQLFEMTTENRLLLIYGQSGTGKTSLVQCGLASRFYSTDWYPQFIRRNEDINQSLLSTLTRSVSSFAGEAVKIESLAEMVEELYEYYLRPVYLIFDQLEELFILGGKAEQDLFIQTIAALLTANLPCRVLFILREEYLAHLYGFEKIIPSLFDHRLRVEPMSQFKVGEVIRNSCSAFKIQLEGEEQDVQQIVDNVSIGQSGIQLPYLQVYLDRLWREAAKESGQRQDKENADGVVFKTTIIQRLGNIKKILPLFLEEREIQIWSELVKYYPEQKEGRKILKSVLDGFVTDEGTKRPIPFETKDELIIIAERLKDKFPTENPLLSDCIKALEENRILRVRDGNYELAHDSLAVMIDRGRTEEQRRRNEVKRRIAGYHLEWKHSGEYPTRKQLHSVEDYLGRLQLDDHLATFMRDSYAHNDAIEREMEEKRRAELEKEQQLRVEAEKARTQAEKAKQEAESHADQAAYNARKARRRFWVGAMMAILATVAMIYAVRQERLAQSNLNGLYEAQAEKVRKEMSEIVLRAEGLRVQDYEREARLLLLEARDSVLLVGKNEKNPYLQEDIDFLQNLIKESN